MKKHFFAIILIGSALLCVLSIGFGQFTPQLLAFPFGQLANGLRALSLSGDVGNITAIIIYIIISAIPMVIFVFRYRRGFIAVDLLLPVISATTAIGLYIMINPFLLWGGEMGESGIQNAMFGGVIYSCIIAYVVLIGIKAAGAADVKSLAKGVCALLCLVAVSFVVAFAVKFDEVLSLIEGSGEINATAIIILGCIVETLPYLLSLAVIANAIKLLLLLAENQHSDEGVTAASKLAKLCGKVLTITVITTAIFNVLQLVFVFVINHVDILVQIPISSMLITVTTLLFCKYIEKNKKLKDENEAFI